MKKEAKIWGISLGHLLLADSDRLVDTLLAEFIVNAAELGAPMDVGYVRSILEEGMENVHEWSFDCEPTVETIENDALIAVKTSDKGTLLDNYKFLKSLSKENLYQAKLEVNTEGTLTTTHKITYDQVNGHTLLTLLRRMINELPENDSYEVILTMDRYSIMLTR